MWRSIILILSLTLLSSCSTINTQSVTPGDIPCSLENYEVFLGNINPRPEYSALWSSQGSSSGTSSKTKATVLVKNEILAEAKGETELYVQTEGTSTIPVTVDYFKDYIEPTQTGMLARAQENFIPDAVNKTNGVCCFQDISAFGGVSKDACFSEGQIIRYGEYGRFGFSWNLIED